MNLFKIKEKEDAKEFIEGRDFYYENGLMVITEYYHLERGYCCGNGCRHCPYDDEGTAFKAGNTKVRS
jgi:hypothetical protein